MKRIYYSSLLIILFAFGIGITKGYPYFQNDMILTEYEQETKISFSDNRLIIENLQQDSILEVFSIVGVKVYSIKIKAGSNEYPINLPKGYYIIRIGNIAKKIALR